MKYKALIGRIVMCVYCRGFRPAAEHPNGYPVCMTCLRHQSTVSSSNCVTRITRDPAFMTFPNNWIVAKAVQ